MKTQLLTFIDALRGSGLTVSTAESIDALRATAALGVERTLFREGLASALIKDEADRAAFDALFDRHFGLAKPPRPRAAPAPVHGDGTGAGRTPSATPSMTPHFRPPQSRDETPESPGVTPRETHDDPSSPRTAQQARLARQRSLRRMPIDDMSARDVEECAALVAALARSLRLHLHRRQRPMQRGRLDVRRTLRRSISTGGVPLDPAFRKRRPAPVDLVALCDYSHSVVTASEFFLALLAPARDYFRRSHLFAFVDQPVPISFAGHAMVPDGHLDLYARSDLGRTLVAFWATYHSLLTRNTIVLILGDARNNRRPPRADVLGRIHTAVRRVVWLNPEPQRLWGTGDCAIHTYTRHCDAVLAASTLEQLTRCLRDTLGAR